MPEDSAPIDKLVNESITKYLELRNYIEKEKERLKKKLEKFEEAKDYISSFLSSSLASSRLKRVSGERGTVFNSDIVKYKVVDARAYLNWLIKTGEWETVKLEPIAGETDALVFEAFEKWKEQNKNRELLPHEIPRFQDFMPPGLNRTVVTILKVKSGD